MIILWLAHEYGASIVCAVCDYVMSSVVLLCD